MAQSGATHPSNLTALNSPDDTVGPGPGLSRHLAHRNIMELLLAPWSCDGRSAEMAQSAARCPPLDGRLKMLRDVAGPSFGAFGAVGVRGFAMFKVIKPSPFALATAEKPT
jgi:hypothetical protein